MLAHGALLTELSELRLSLLSEKDATLVLAVEDRDGATFHHAFPVTAGKLAAVRVRPTDFELNDDSPVKKKRLDPKRLGAGFALFDAGALTGTAGQNALAVEGAQVARMDISRTAGDMVVEKPVSLSESLFREGNITVRKGGRLTVSAPRFVLRGNVQVEDGTLEVSGGVFVMPQRFNHELALTIVGKSRVLLKDTLFLTAAPLTVNLGGGSSFEVENVALEGGFTCTPEAKSRIRIEKAKGTAEVIVPPDVDLSIADTKQAILWLSAGENFKGRLTLPPGEAVKDWTSGNGLKARVRNSSVLWCLISQAGSDGSVEKTNIDGVGLLFGGNTAVAFRDIHNGRSLKSYTVPAPDRKLQFSDSKVAAWNYYAAEKARVSIERSTFGEALAFGEGKIEIRDSTCDGKGGYVGAHEKSEIHATDSKIASLVVAKDEATIVLKNCHVTGDVRATGRGTVRLIGCEIAGRIEQDPGARVIRE